MKWFMNFSLKSKIGLVLGFFTFILFAIVYYSYNNINTIKDRQERLSGRYLQLQSSVLKLRDEISYFRIEFLQSLVKPEQKRFSSLERKYSSFTISVDALFKNLGDLVRRDVRFGEEVTNILKAFEEYKQTTEQHLTQMRGKLSSDEIDTLTSQQAAQFNLIVPMLADLVSQTQKEITSNFQETNNQIVWTIMIFLCTAILFLGISIFIRIQSDKIISNPLNNLASASSKLALGDVETDVPLLDRKDEIGKLYLAFLGMLNSIKEVGKLTDSIASGDLTLKLVQKSDKDAIVRSLNTMVSQLRSVIADSKDSMEVISNATNKIFGAVSQLSAASNETATAIGETTVTIEEVKKTSEVLSKKAREINSIAQRASEISETGLRSTEDTIQGIQNIGNQMEIIGESIMKLTEQSRAIGDIIASVNDLAEQSNLLAVNAAIEAARAGEHGKSFVVVAQEIKSLAQQSKQATAQVKSVLNDIQNAINSTVLATEQGEKIVNAGVNLSKQTREAIKNLTDTITLFTDISMQTNASSQEQFIGMEQVAIAMDNIKVASSQNAVITRELEQSARNLQYLTEKLRDTIAIFKV